MPCTDFRRGEVAFGDGLKVPHAEERAVGHSWVARRSGKGGAAITGQPWGIISTPRERLEAMWQASPGSYGTVATAWHRLSSASHGSAGVPLP